MHFERGHVYRVLILFIVLWTALAIVAGPINKVDADAGSASGSHETAIELGLKLCAVVFTAVATVASGVLHKLWRRLPEARTGIRHYAPATLRDRYRPPPHGISLLRHLQIIVV